MNRNEKFNGKSTGWKFNELYSHFLFHEHEENIYNADKDLIVNLTYTEE